MAAYSGCDDGTTDNIKERLKRQKRPTTRFASAKNPIPEQIKDAQEYEKFFKTYKDTFIPYAGTDKYTAHSLLGFLMSLRDLSPTQAACIRSKNTYCLGGEVDIVKRYNPVFKVERNTEVSESEKEQFIEFVESVRFHAYDRSDISVRRFAKLLRQDIEASGNTYIELVFVDVGGVRQAHAYLHSPTDCLYLVTKAGEPRQIAVSPIWSEQYIRENPPDVLPVFPNYRIERGQARTLIHWKEGNYKYYGRPGSMSSILHQFLEFQNADYLNKATASQFTGQAFIEVEHEGGINDEEAQDDGFQDFADQMEQNFTMKGDDPQTVLVSARPIGSQPAFVFQFKPNTNQDWYKVTNEEAEKMILKSHAWPGRFIKDDQASGLSTNVFLDVFEINSVTTIREIQHDTGELINTILAEAAKFYENSDAMNYSIQFTSPFQQLLEQRKENEQSDNSLGGGEV